jgi:hypothetical protein
MIACVSPSDRNFEESIQTLNYAMKTNNIRNRPMKNRDLNAALMERLRLKNIQSDVEK